ncbi:hypothetical protein DFH08DRAFT_816418 [Mycena albidolilacea]|uniref:Uncharacterized protein n=1 Tax=Mycena albidolilacea TaxID=1033008 RepID=A0AAD7EJP4_9AGAR|nr:hypothetical protein DFH08DRAFT_816418 [Mycena albidolilacea]
MWHGDAVNCWYLTSFCSGLGRQWRSSAEELLVSILVSVYKRLAWTTFTTIPNLLLYRLRRWQQPSPFVQIRKQRSRLELGLSHLEALAAGNTQRSQFAYTLKIKRLSPAVAAGADANELQVARWTFTPCAENSRWTVETVHSFMGSLALLEDFQLTSDFAKNLDCSFDHITHLRKQTLMSSAAMSLGALCQTVSHMVGNNSHLSALHLATKHHRNHSPLHGFADLFRSVGQPLRLTELRLFQYSLKLDGGTVLYLRSFQSLWLFSRNATTWDTLRVERIHLSELHTNMMVEGLIEYISSYSALERLTIVQADDEFEGRNLEQSNQRADRFFSALPHHQTSLFALSCGVYSASEGRWSFGSHNVGVLEQLHKLRSLRINVNSVVAGRLESDEDGRNMVHRFLDLVDQLPISDAVIMPSFLQRFMGNPCGNGLISNRGIIIGEIDAAVRAFKSRGSQTSGAVVFAGYNY